MPSMGRGRGNVASTNLERGPVCGSAITRSAPGSNLLG